MKGEEDATLISKPTGNLLGYYHRLTGFAKKGESCLDSGKYMWSYTKWSQPVNIANVIDNIEKWHTNVQEYAVVRCVNCGDYHGQSDWSGVRCPKCEKLTLKASLKDAGGWPLPVCVLAGNRVQFTQYCKDKGENPYTTDAFIDGSQGMIHGHHFSGIVIVGTFEEKVDANEILMYAKANLEPGGQITGGNVVKPKPLLVVKPVNIWKGADGVPTASKPFLLPKKEEPKMKNGEVRKLPKANSPMWVTQWAAQGTAKTPYIVSKKDTPSGATTSEGWACSCPSFTQNSPRADCKHICWVRKFENIPMSAAPVAMLPKEQQEAFKKFLLEQAKAGNPAIKVEKKPFITQGRRFR